MKEVSSNRMSQFPIESIKYKNIKCVFKIMALVVICLSMIWGRALYGSKKAYQQAETFLESNQTIKAITFFDRSIHWYTPFNPYVERSAERLWNIGKNAENKEDTKLALIAFRTIRGGFYSTNSFYKPGREWIKKCDIQINQLMQLELRKRGTPDSSKVKGGYITERQKDPSPSIFWTIFLEIGCLGWIGSVMGFIMFILGRKGESKYSTFSSLVWIILTFVFFALWIIGMMKA